MELMNVFKKFIGKLLFPRTYKFTNDLKNAFLEAVKETSKFDASVRDLLQTWLAVCPNTYFSELFFETEDCNIPFVQAFERSDNRFRSHIIKHKMYAKLYNFF